MNLTNVNFNLFRADVEKALAAVAEKYGCDVLWVNADNKRAIRTYEKNGYVISEPTMYLMKRDKKAE